MLNITETNEESHPWYKSAIFYEISVKSFFDGNNDGIGDFIGLSKKLDYLTDLGVTCLWLLPFYPSPWKDDGYDVSDYCAVHPLLGSMNDFEDFIQKSHSKNIRVIADLVLNHTSDQHPWFQESRSSLDSPKRNYYVWSKSDALYEGTRIIFSDIESSNWTYDSLTGQYYWHRFYSHQPDLNYDSQAVQLEMFEVVKFWLDKGLDGFRLDAVPYLFESSGTNNEGLPETHEFLKRLRKFIDGRYGKFEKVLLAEANQEAKQLMTYFGHGDELHMAFHFPLMPLLYYGVAKENRSKIMDIIEKTRHIPQRCQWCIFLRNHDELTLEKLSKEDREIMWDHYAPNTRMRLNCGIRRRLAPLMDNHRQKIELMNALLLSLPGSPMIYYGDEIGMGDNINLDDRYGVRTPMQWSDSINAGFSTIKESGLYPPVITDPPFNFENVNVETQGKDGYSLLQFMKKLIEIRKKYECLALGDIIFLDAGNDAVLAFVRSYKDSSLLCINNLSKEGIPCYIKESFISMKRLFDVFKKNESVKLEDSILEIRLVPFQFLWLELR